MDHTPSVPSTELPLSPAVQEAWQNLERLNDRALTFIRERPGTCLVGALAFGYLVGKIAARR